MAGLPGVRRWRGAGARAWLAAVALGGCALGGCALGGCARALEPDPSPPWRPGGAAAEASATPAAGAANAPPGDAVGGPAAEATDALNDWLPFGETDLPGLESPAPQLPGAPEPAEPDDDRRYRMLPGVSLSPVVQQKVTSIAEAYFRKTGREIVVTSGTRDPGRQAEAMHELFRLGADVHGLYKNKAAIQEIQRVYDQGRARARPPEAVVSAMAEVIRGQITRGIFISAHLRAGAVDIRNRDMTARERKAFLEAVAEVGGVRALEETRPPHYHLQVE